MYTTFLETNPLQSTYHSLIKIAQPNRKIPFRVKNLFLKECSHPMKSDLEVPKSNFLRVFLKMILRIEILKILIFVSRYPSDISLVSSMYDTHIFIKTSASIT